MRNTSLFTRVAVSAVVAILALHVAMAFFYGHKQLVESASAFASSTAERAIAIEAVLPENPDLLGVLSDSRFTATIHDQAPTLPNNSWPHAEEVRSALMEHLVELNYSNRQKLRIGVERQRRGPPTLVLQIPTQNSRWLQVRSTMSYPRGNPGLGVVWTSLLVGIVLGGVLWGMRRVTRHLPRFVEAAEKLGNNLRAPALPDRGPKEIRRASAAFNQMQDRIRTQLDERTAMVAAFSHDVRTLVTRLQLRMEHIPDPAQRTHASNDLDAITTLVDETLEYTRDQHHEAPFEIVDLSSLLSTLVDNEADLGRSASFAGPDRLLVTGQVTALRRAFANLIDNAIRYGESARITLDSDQDHAVISIEDNGDGIPPHLHAAVLKPYVRVDDSRSRETGGTGLGLAITNNVIRRHRGTLRMTNRLKDHEFKDQESNDHKSSIANSGDELQSGFCVTVELPLAREH